jgi:hypothetical protein
MTLLQSLNDCLFYFGYVLYRVYDVVWTQYLLKVTEKIRGKFRKPIDAVLPQNDSDFRIRYTLLRHQATYFENYGKTFVQMPFFQVITFLVQEFFPNILIVGTVLAWSVFEYFNDGRTIDSRKDLEAIVKRFGLVDDFVAITDDNCYQLNTAFEIMKKMTLSKQSKLINRISSATYFTVNKKNFVDNFTTTDYYYQDCDTLNDTMTFDVDGLYVPYMDSDGNKRLRLDTIVLTDKKDKSYPTFVFQKSDQQWIVIRNNYINWTRSDASIMLHQLGCNIYCPSVLQHMRQTLSDKHPVSVLTKPFFEGVYFTNNIFTTFGISAANTEKQLINSYMDRVELFDLSNETMISALKTFHATEGKYILNYPEMLPNHGVDDIYFEQKKLLTQTYDIVCELVTSVINYYYKNENDFTMDTELDDFATGISKDYEFVGNVRKKNELITFLTNIIYLSSVRHSQSHMNFCFLANFYEYALRKTDLDMLLDKLKTVRNLTFDESMLYSTYGNFYNRYASGIYPSVPVNLFELGYENYFKDPSVNKFYDVMTTKFIVLRNTIKRDQFTEFMFRMEKSNTI